MGHASPMSDAAQFPVPPASSDERELLLAFLDWKRGSVLKTCEGLSDEQARWTPTGKLLPIAGIVNHLTHVESRWIDGRYLRAPAPKADPDVEFASQAPLADLVAGYLRRRDRTNEIVRAAPGLDAPCLGNETQAPFPGLELRWCLLHLLDETSHHAGHADATREMLDGRRSTD